MEKREHLGEGTSPQGERAYIENPRDKTEEEHAGAEDKLALEPKAVKDSLLHGPDYDEVEE